MALLPDGAAATVEAPRTDHTHVAHGVAWKKAGLNMAVVPCGYTLEFICQGELLTDLADELSELIQVALSIRSEAQLSDASVELFCALKRVLQQQQKYTTKQ